MTEGMVALTFFIATIVVAVLGWFLRNWAMSLKGSIDKIHDKMANMNSWMQDHITTTERRLTRVETKVDMVVLGEHRRKEAEDDGKTNLN